MFIVHDQYEDTVLKCVYSGILMSMYLVLYVVLIIIMSYFIMYFVSDDKNKGDQSTNQSLYKAGWNYFAIPKCQRRNIWSWGINK